jgi:hypothetical protein
LDLIRRVQVIPTKHPHWMLLNWLVVDLPLGKIWVNGKDDIPYTMQKKNLFQTTN